MTDSTEAAGTFAVRGARSDDIPRLGEIETQAVAAFRAERCRLGGAAARRAR